MSEGKIKKPAIISYAEAFGETGSVPPEVEQEFKKKGWVPRWLNSIELSRRYGMHPRGWKLYKRDKSLAPVSGQDSEGCIRSVDLVLGYKESLDHKKHTQYLKQQADIQSHKQAAQTDEVRNELESKGFKTSVKGSFSSSKELLED